MRACLDGRGARHTAFTGTLLHGDGAQRRRRKLGGRPLTPERHERPYDRANRGPARVDFRRRWEW